ncbi:MAG: hypothetical protein PHO15_08980, partial [Eubacteriales bacterium]|nr:hypothetical protein [Eubacteriales bacterium]
MLNKETYLNTVCSEIKFKAARKFLRQELSAHIDDKKEALEKDAVPDAESKAVAAMGDAAETGRALNAIHKPRTAWSVIACVLLLSIAGIFAIKAGTAFSHYASYSEMNDLFWSEFLHYLLPVIVFGLGVMTVMYFVDYTWLKRLWYVFFGAALLYIAVYMYYNPVTMYVFEGPLGQSAAIVISALFFMLGLFGFMERNKDKGFRGLLYTAILCAVSVLAMSVISTVYALLLTVVTIAALAVMISESNQPKKWRWFTVISGGLAAVFILCMLWPPLHYYAFGTDIQLGEQLYSTEMVKDMLQGAKLVGASPNYIQNQTWDLTGSRTGYILTAVIGAYGWLAGIGIALVFAALFASMAVYSQRVTHPFGRLLASGISAFFCIRFVLFMLANLGLIGGISVNLPFVSYRSFNYVADALLTGIFLSVW